jgi:hypothetical protein
MPMPGGGAACGGGLSPARGGANPAGGMLTGGIPPPIPPPMCGLTRPALGSAGVPGSTAGAPKPGRIANAILAAIFFSNISSVSCCSN